MATIRKKKLHPSGRVVWELSHGTPPNRDRFIAGYTKEEAEATLKAYKRQLARHGTAPESLSVSEAIMAYGKFLEVNRSPSTVRRYVRILHTFEACFLRIFHPSIELLRQIRPAHVEEYKERRYSAEIEETDGPAEKAREEGLREVLAENPTSASYADNARYGWLGRKRLARVVTKKTVNYEVKTVRTFFSWCVKRNYLFTNPAADVELFRLSRQSLPKFLTKDELTAFLRACKDYERRVFTIVLLTGMRRGEIEHLEWADVNADLGVIFIRPKADWKPKTGERVIPISEALQAVLMEHWQDRRSDKWVIANRAGNRETHLLEKVKKVCRKAEIAPQAATVHALRHSFGAHLRMAGVPLATIADLMGHQDLATTQIYAKVEMTHLREQVGRMTEAVPGVLEPAQRPMTLENVTCGDSGALRDSKLLR